VPAFAMTAEATVLGGRAVRRIVLATGVGVGNLYTLVQEATDHLRQRTGVIPRAGIILGTGLGGLVERMAVANRIPYSSIPHFPASTVESHEGNLVFGNLGGCEVVVMQGRLHYYEGYSLQQVTLPVRIMRELGAEFLVINSAAGGLNQTFSAGDVMIVTDHINLVGDNPLRGLTDPRLGDRFPDMSRPYDQRLVEIAGRIALGRKIAVRYGVYAAVSGPSLETPAETRMLRHLGADAVGMSTVPEVITAAQVGFQTLALAAITNVNRPDAMEPVSVEQVIATAGRVGPKLAEIVEYTLQELAESRDTRAGRS